MILNPHHSIVVSIKLINKCKVIIVTPISSPLTVSSGAKIEALLLLGQCTSLCIFIT